MRYADLKLNDVANGPGINVSFWVQGCPFKCPNCHNPETWDYEGGKEFTQDVLDKIIKTLQMDDVTRGLSILGGEPLCPENLFLTDLVITTVKQQLPQIPVYLWTGYTYEYLLKFSDARINHILNQVDVLIDGPYIEAEKDITLSMRGSRNQRIIPLTHEE